MSLIYTLIKSAFFSFLALMFIVPNSYSDVGKTLLEVTCSPQEHRFTVTPYILWNENYEKLKPHLELGKGKYSDGEHSYFQVNPMKAQLSSQCDLSPQTSITVELRDRTLQVYENHHLIISLAINNVWDFFGPSFAIRFLSRTGWQEMCVEDQDSEKSVVWKKLDRQRSTSDCR